MLPRLNGSVVGYREARRGNISKLVFAAYFTNERDVTKVLIQQLERQTNSNRRKVDLRSKMKGVSLARAVYSFWSLPSTRVFKRESESIRLKLDPRKPRDETEDA